jgi:tRNA(Ser,Leu) C12 N-acetylase TAN1
MTKRTTDDNYYGVMLEDMNSKINAILEIAIPLRKEVTEIKQIVKVMPEIQTDLKTIKAAIKATNLHVRGHDRAIAELKAKLSLA